MPAVTAAWKGLNNSILKAMGGVERADIKSELWLFVFAVT